MSEIKALLKQLNSADALSFLDSIGIKELPGGPPGGASVYPDRKEMSPEEFQALKLSDVKTSKSVRGKQEYPGLSVGIETVGVQKLVFDLIERIEESGATHVFDIGGKTGRLELYIRRYMRDSKVTFVTVDPFPNAPHMYKGTFQDWYAEHGLPPSAKVFLLLMCSLKSQ